MPKALRGAGPTHLPDPPAPGCLPALPPLCTHPCSTACIFPIPTLAHYLPETSAWLRVILQESPPWEDLLILHGGVRCHHLHLLSPAPGALIINNLSKLCCSCPPRGRHVLSTWLRPWPTEERQPASNHGTDPERFPLQLSAPTAQKTTLPRRRKNARLKYCWMLLETVCRGKTNK